MTLEVVGFRKGRCGSRRSSCQLFGRLSPGRADALAVAGTIVKY